MLIYNKDNHTDFEIQVINETTFEDLKITDPKLFKFGQPFERSWYNINDKKSKEKLGKMYHSTLKMHSKDKERACLCRIIDLERISAYTIESFENRLKLLMNIKGSNRFWAQP